MRTSLVTSGCSDGSEGARGTWRCAGLCCVFLLLALAGTAMCAFAGDDAKVYLRSDPPGAWIFHGKKDKEPVVFTAMNAKTPGLVTAPEGPQVFQLRLEGFKDKTVTVEATVAGIVKPDVVVLDRAAAEPVSVDVIFEEDGWQLLVDDKPILDVFGKPATPPCTVKVLPGRHTFTLKKGGADSVTRGYEVLAGGKQLLSFAALEGVTKDKDETSPKDRAYRAWMEFAEGQDRYHKVDWDGDGVLEYALSFIGKGSLHDPSAGRENVCLLSKQMAEAQGEPGRGPSYHGYRFKILTGNETKSFMVNGNLSKGYALLIYPAKYGGRWRDTYIACNTDLILYSKDLGEGTHRTVSDMSIYRLDDTWRMVKWDAGPQPGAQRPDDPGNVPTADQKEVVRAAAAHSTFSKQQLSVGQAVLLTASGAWTPSAYRGTCGANGLRERHGESGANYGALLVRIEGEQEFRQAGSLAVLKAARAGRLEFAINSVSTDRTGELVVTVSPVPRVGAEVVIVSAKEHAFSNQVMTAGQRVNLSAAGTWHPSAHGGVCGPDGTSERSGAGDAHYGGLLVRIEGASRVNEVGKELLFEADRPGRLEFFMNGESSDRVGDLAVVIGLPGGGAVTLGAEDGGSAKERYDAAMAELSAAIRAQDWAKAEWASKRALAEKPDEADLVALSCMIRGVRAVQVNAWGDAQKHFEEGLKASPNPEITAEIKKQLGAVRELNGGAGGPQVAEYRTDGCIFTSPAELEKTPRAGLMSRAAKEFPPSVDLSSKFPQPGNQGRQGSCLAWALAYLKSYQEGLEMGWSLADQRARFSPAFIYNQINKGLDKGSFPQDGLSLLQEKGCVTIEDFPYDPDNYTKQPPGSLAAKAASFRIEKWARVDPKNTQAIKECLANSQPIIVGADCPLLFQLWGFGVGRLGIYAGMFGSYQGGETQSGGHAMCVVGYDDGKKAFKLINSWGANWGDAGFAWIDYASFGQMVREAYVTQDSKNNMALPGPPTPLAQLPKGVYRVRLTRWNWAEEDWTRLFNDDAHGIKLVIAKNGRNIFAPFRPLCGERGDHVVFADISWECEYDGTSQYTVELEECGPAAGLLDGGDVLAKLKMKRWQSAPNPWPWQARIMVGKSSYIETMVERR